MMIDCDVIINVSLVEGRKEEERGQFVEVIKKASALPRRRKRVELNKGGANAKGSCLEGQKRHR
jgi:hypothetical protein